MRRCLRAWVILFSATCQGAAVANSQPLTTLPGQGRFTYDPVTLPQNEKMGLVGGNIVFEPTRWAYVGLGTYGAVSGNRGGFFTGGFEAGVRTSLWRSFSIDTGLFVGGGGGGAAPQGGGLMLRPHVGVLYGSGNNVIGLGFSQVRFPNGDINSSQAYITIERRFAALLRSGWSGDEGLAGVAFQQSGVSFKRRWFALQGLAYFPESATRGRSGRALDARIDLIGVRWRQMSYGAHYIEFETAGAWGGNVDGFAQVLLGSGFFPYRSSRFAWAVGSMLGGAGGGDVDTGGGAIYRFYTGINGRIGQALWLTAEAGYTAAFNDGFAGLSTTLGVSYSYEPLTFNAGSGALYDATDVHWARWRLRAASQRYVPVDSGARKTPTLDDEPVDLIGLKADRWVSDSFFLTGQAWGAYRGGAGGYAVGLVGFGWAMPALWRLTPELEFLAGAAGGGGMAVGGGIIVQPMINLSYPLGMGFDMALSYGYAAAPSSTFDAHVMEVSIAYRFATVHRGSSGR